MAFELDGELVGTVRAVPFGHGLTLAEKLLDLVKVRVGRVFKNAEPESLCQWRSDGIKHRVRSADFDPCRIAVWKKPLPRFDAISISTCLGALEFS